MKPLPIYPLLFFFAVVFMSCQPGVPPNTVWSGSAAIADGRSIPFVLDMDLTSDPPVAAFLVGDERTPVPEVIVRGDSIHLIASEYDAAFRLLWDGQTLAGRYERYRSDTTGFAISATPGRPARISSRREPAVPLTGSYRVFIPSNSGQDSSRTAVFWVRSDSVYGTIIAPFGDDGLFAGTQDGDTVRLARFTAWQSIYLEFVRKETEWHGSRFIRDLPPGTLTLSARPQEILTETPDEKTRLRAGLDGFSFSGITLEGDTLDHLSDRFAGKPLIIDIMGTWCHNCLDGAPVLQQLYEEFSGDGLEIVSLAFELKDDVSSGLRNLRIFRDRHDLSYPLIYCGDISKQNVDERIKSQLDNFGAYPTAIFVDRSGMVVDIHKGFRGPGTGDGFQREVQLFYDRVRRIIRK